MQLKKKIVGLIVILLLMLISLVVGIRSNQRPAKPAVKAMSLKSD